MVTTRSKSVKKVDRKKQVRNALRIADEVIGAVREIFKKEDFDVNAIDMPETNLIMTALPLSQEERKLLIEHVEFTI